MDKERPFFLACARQEVVMNSAHFFGACLKAGTCQVNLATEKLMINNYFVSGRATKPVMMSNGSVWISYATAPTCSELRRLNGRGRSHLPRTSFSRFVIQLASESDRSQLHCAPKVKWEPPLPLAKIHCQTVSYPTCE